MNTLSTSAWKAPKDGTAADPSCQVIYAPAVAGEQLVPDTSVGRRPIGTMTVGAGGEIRLTYAELTALVDEAVKHVVRR